MNLHYAETLPVSFDHPSYAIRYIKRLLGILMPRVFFSSDTVHARGETLFRR